jgi:hypothetical protein
VTVKIIMSYARPLFWMGVRVLKDITMRMLALLPGFIIALPTIFVWFWLQDTFNIRF